MSFIPVYVTDENGIFLRADRAFESPREPGVYMYPPGSVTITPPSFDPTSHHVRWTGVSWSVEPIPAEPDPLIPHWDDLSDAQKKERVNAERDRRIYGGVTYIVDGQPYVFDSDEVSQGRVGHSAALARFAILGGAEADDYRWHGKDFDFAWITMSDTVVLDAFEMAGLGDVFLEHVAFLVHAAKAIKELDPIPEDYDDDARWP